MKVEIWSDIICPFCYIGKRQFEIAMEQFAHRTHIEVEWKSYQLMPELKTSLDKSMNDILIESKGVSRSQAETMNERVMQMALQVGLNYNIEKSIPANTFKAHRFAHFAKTQGKQNEAAEALFKAYFTDAKNIDDSDVLLELGIDIGLEITSLRAVLSNNSYADSVEKDISDANRIGVRGVPFFVFDSKQAVSGAQESTTFLQVLESSFTEWRKNNPENKFNVIKGQSCTPQGECK